jgi:hypothetical protein
MQDPLASYSEARQWASAAQQQAHEITTDLNQSSGHLRLQACDAAMHFVRSSGELASRLHQLSYSTPERKGMNWAQGVSNEVAKTSQVVRVSVSRCLPTAASHRVMPTAEWSVRIHRVRMFGLASIH